MNSIFLQKINFKEKILLLVIVMGSISLFLYYLNLNNSVNYYDEGGYIEFAQKIIELGLFNVESDIRTYLFPLIISLFLFIFDGNLDYAKIAMSIFQFLVYVFTVIFITTNTIKNNSRDSKIIGMSILFFGLLNPYLIQSTTLLLTDLLASCFIVLSISIILYKNILRISVSSISIFLIYAAVMIRPSSLIFLPIVLGFSLYKIIKLNKIKRTMINNILKYFLIVFAFLILFFPQIYMNVTKFNHFTPLIHVSLYEDQSKWAVQSLKYGTVTVEGQEPTLHFKSPIMLGEDFTIFELIYKNIFAFIYIYSAHIFGVFDWGYVDTYIKDFYPISRIFGSIFLYSTWYFIFIGIFKFFVNYNSERTKINLGLLVSAILYTLFIATTLIESRFGYPILLLLLPFAGYGIQSMKLNILKVVSFFFVILVCFTISFSLDLQTNRINWYQHLTVKDTSNLKITKELNQKQDWEFVRDYNGYKVFQFKAFKDIGQAQDMILEKSDGTKLQFDDDFSSAEKFSNRHWENPHHFVISVSDKDTKWEEDYIPTTVDIKNYFKKYPYNIIYSK